MDALVPARAGRRNTRIGTLGMAGLAIYLFAIRPWQLRWGAADAEVHQAFPGDDCVPRPRFETTRAVTIRASAADVWAWLVQLGSDRAGYYSYDWLEKRLGLDITNVDRIVPEFQKREVGDRVL